MHVLLKENLEGYLSGNLQPGEREQLKAHLAACSACRQELEAMQESAGWLRRLGPPAGDTQDWEPAPGFYARVIERIETEREVPFWAMLLDPAFGRRIVFACLLLLAVLGAYVAAVEQPDYPSIHRPEAILAGHPAPGSPMSRAPRLGKSLDHNRGVVLAALVAEGD